jgi:hypothetical protein
MSAIKGVDILDSARALSSLLVIPERASAATFSLPLQNSIS